VKDYLSAAEIAALNLPGLPATKRGVQFVALRAQWIGRQRAGRGGGIEYALDVLPADARAAYVSRHVAAVAVPTTVARDAAQAPGAAALTGNATESRDARLALLAVADKFAADAKLGRKRADLHFCDEFNAARIVVADWIKAEVRSLTPRTLKRWRALVRDGRSAKLGIDRGARRRGTGVLDRANNGEVKAHILALVTKQPQLTAHHIRAIICDVFDRFIILDGQKLPMPGVRVFQHALKHWKVRYGVAIESVRNPDRFKSAMRFAARVANPAPHVNALWQIDASPADVLTTDGRYSLYVCEDIFSRRLVATVSKTARAAGVGLLVRKAIMAWGVPDVIKTDNGSDFIARDTQRLFAALAIGHETAAPFRPEQKGHIERAIGTLQRGLMRTLEGFIGHSVADRKVIEGRKAFAARLGEAPEDTFQVALSASDLQARVDEWCAAVYGHAPHAGLKGQSPFAAAAMCSHPLRRIENARALDMLLAPVAGKDGLRIVTKTGLRIDGVHYVGGFLEVGKSVLVRMDPADMGRAYVFLEDGSTFLGEAIAPEVLGIDPAQAIAAARAEQKRVIDEQLADVRKRARSIKAKDFAPAILRQALIDAGKLAEFPKPAAAHETPALAAARAAVDRDIAPEHSDEVLALHARLLAETQVESLPPSNVTALRSEETSHQRWNRARSIEAAIARNEHVEPDDLIWLGGYRDGPEYRGFQLTYGDLQPTADPCAAGAG
jgi:putative transposase